MARYKNQGMKIGRIICTVRKRLRSKRRSCPLCKPNKTGHSCRWSDKELEYLRRWEKEKTNYLKVLS